MIKTPLAGFDGSYLVGKSAKVSLPTFFGPFYVKDYSKILVAKEELRVLVKRNIKINMSEEGETKFRNA